MIRALGLGIVLLLVMGSAGAVELSLKGGYAETNLEKVGHFKVEWARHLAATVHGIADVTRFASLEADFGVWSRPVGSQGLLYDKSQLPYPIDHPWRGIYEAVRLVSRGPILTITKSGLLNIDGGLGIVFHQAWPEPPRIRPDYFKAETHIRGQALLRMNFGPVYLAGEWQPAITDGNGVDLLASFGYRVWAI